MSIKCEILIWIIGAILIGLVCFWLTTQKPMPVCEYELPGLTGKYCQARDVTQGAIYYESKDYKIYIK
jgi:hypothetical protein